MSLTDTAIKRLQPSENCTPNNPDKHTDKDGLRLWVRHTGAKVFVSDYTYNGKRQSLTLGKYPQMSLAQARGEHLRLKKLIANGIDPKSEKSKSKQESTAFDTYAQKWLAHHETRVKPSTFKRDLSAYDRHIKPMLGTKDIYKITLADIMAVHDRQAGINNTCTAHRVIGWIGAIYDHAIIKGYAPNLLNPIPRGIHKELVVHTSTKHARIKINELPKLLADIDNSDVEPLTKWAFYLMLYTFVRTDELLGMQWQEVDFNTCLWHIPAQRMKMKLPHVVPLAPQAIEILQRIKAMGFCDDYVFFSNRSRTSKRLSNGVFSTALKRMGYRGRMTGHGFRGLASTSLYDMQYSPKAIELQLSHVVGSKVERAYNESEMLPKRTQMMNEWANIIDQIRQGDFSTYKNRLTAENNSQQLAIFLKSLEFDKAQIKDEINTHTLEIAEIKAMQ